MFISFEIKKEFSRGRSDQYYPYTKKQKKEKEKKDFSP